MSRLLEIIESRLSETKMMEVNKEEKYILLNNDSDLEEFHKSKVSLMHQTQNGFMICGLA